MEKISYGGWPNCIRLANNKIELIATTDIGPRIIRFGFIGGDNEFHEDPKQIGLIGGNEWRAYGGHRLWHAPEANPRTYYPDNQPVDYSFDDGVLCLTQETEKTTGIQKSISIKIDPNESKVEIVHKLTNRNLWTVELAPWALSVMREGGVAIFPHEPYSPHPDIPDFEGQVIDHRYYLPVRSLVLWSYTKLNDPRWKFLGKYLLLRQDENANRPQKIGLSNEQGWAAYANNGRLFVKVVKYIPGACYPDRGCIFETFTNNEMLELESLGPFSKIEPGATIEHIEEWYLFSNVEFEESDESLDKTVLPIVSNILG